MLLQVAIYYNYGFSPYSIIATPHTIRIRVFDKARVVNQSFQLVLRCLSIRIISAYNSHNCVTAAITRCKKNTRNLCAYPSLKVSFIRQTQHMEQTNYF